MPVSNAQGLRSTGLKVTQPRLKILEIFQKSAMRHMTAEDVYRELLNDNSRDVGLATVYRVLTQFEQAGILSRTHFESGKAIFEINEGKHHDHLLCLDCGRVEEFVDPEIERRQKKIAAEHGFALQEHSLALYATCTREGCPHRPAQPSAFEGT
ncbi:MAG: ferric iron uptake transcriptional regulator [Betaproteobacteria bacterium]|jgi:Fur family ferric uptake transcriptional regulator|uniref:ferric iron uptake transcriptional regulator n=1 Tax=Thiomonas sp. FB-Cd TaxID=1158292 RepID=UPI0004DF5EB9|nr:ferric iron uptake transcriptional regulator [Thiomonas sp. FB-Cd]MDE2252742.1 ferric iron uptake transcriptional regulator [Betaproteobacteria bacterium]